MSITNYDGLLEAMVNNAKDMYLNIAKVNSAYDDTETEVYTGTLPVKYADVESFKKLGGKTVLFNQLLQNGNFIDATGWSASNATLSVVDNTATVAANISTYLAVRLNANQVTMTNSHVYAVILTASSTSGKVMLLPFGSSTYGYKSFNGVTTPTKLIWLYTAAKTDDATMEIRYNVTSSGTSEDITGTATNYMCIDLTQMFGAGNEPSTTTEVEQILSADYYDYNAGELLSAGVSKVVSKDSNNDVIDSYSVPAGVQALDGYGMSCPSAYNYIDVENQKFVQAVASRDYEVGDENDATVITDGTTTNYALDTAVETSVNVSIDLDVEAGGSLTFENTLGDDYCIPVPVQLEMISVS